MRKILLMGLLLAAPFAFAVSPHQVKGHTRKDGKYIQPHKQTNPDQIRRNNYSSEGNYNPATGKQGTRRNEYSNPPEYNDSYNNGQGQRLNQLSGKSRKKHNQPPPTH